jgi:hypothetical protein
MTSTAQGAASETAANAFIFGFPLVLMDVTRAVLTNTPRPTGKQAPVNQFGHLRKFPDAEFRDVVSPNADTLYSSAWLDLSTEPMVLTVPDSGGRYYLLPMLSGWTDVFASPGTRTTGDGARSFAITGPGWHGEVPPELHTIDAPTSMVWVIGRTQTNGTADYAAVHEFQDGLSLVPLSAWGTDYRPPVDVPLEPGVDTGTPPVTQVTGMDPEAFFDRLARLMTANPPAPADAPVMATFESIGLVPGAYAPPPELAEEIAAGARHGLDSLLASATQPISFTPEGWQQLRGLGSYGTRYGMRALIALVGLGANLDDDALYPHATVDGEGHPLTGAHDYRIRFAAGETPPAEAFWSLTMYDSQHFFIQNPIDRYAISDRDDLTVNDDGSIDIWIQHSSPGPEREANWLPAPSGPFNVFLRVYRPGERILSGNWRPPAITRVR